MTNLSSKEKRRRAFNLSDGEYRTLASLKTPNHIQDFLDALPINHEKGGDTNYSPRLVLKEEKAHCIEGALLAAAALWLHGEEPLLLDLRSLKGDDDHVVTLFKRNGHWGALSKTNHATLRFRDPIYRNVHELALSYLHEYFLDTGKKTLRERSEPFRLKRWGSAWITSEEPLFYLGEALDDSPHVSLIPDRNVRSIRPAGPIERRAGSIIEWHATNPRT
jgi:hypothetical protein